MTITQNGLSYRIRQTILGSALTVTLVALPGAHAQADPTVAEIEAQIQQLWAEAEPLIEKYNEIHEDYQKNKAKQTELQKKIEPLQHQLDLAQLRIGVVAAAAYRDGQVGTVNAMLNSDSPRELADQLSFLEQLARAQKLETEEVSQIKAAYDAQKAPLDDLVAALATQDTDLATQRKQIEVRLTELQKLRVKAYGASGSTGSFRPWPCPSEYLPTSGYKAANFACRQAGAPYVWAASGPSSYDCSGLTLAAWRQVGVYLPHNAAAQRRSMPYVSRANLQLGDLVFYFGDLHHVAIYVGGGKVMHAPTFGDRVRMADMNSMPVHSYGRPS